MTELAGRQGMSGPARLERGYRRLLACYPRGYRRLLACYPRAYRRENEEEILAVLLACAHDGQQRPGLAASADLITGQGRCQRGDRDRRVAAAGLGGGLRTQPGQVCLRGVLRPGLPGPAQGDRPGCCGERSPGHGCRRPGMAAHPGRERALVHRGVEPVLPLEAAGRDLVAPDRRHRVTGRARAPRRGRPAATDEDPEVGDMQRRTVLTALAGLPPAGRPLPGRWRLV
jgi:hypothetical protein